MFERKFVSASWSALRAGRGGPTAPDRLAALQSRRLSELVAFARERSPFYRLRYVGLPHHVDHVALLPVVTKPGLMGAFADWSTDRRVSREEVQAFIADQDRLGRLYLGRYAVWTTSGTSGRPGTFLHDVPALGIYAALLATRCWLRWLPPRGRLRLLRRGIRAAIVVATGGHYAAAAIQALAERRFASLSASSRAFSVQEPLPNLVAALNAFEPAILAGYPTAIALLAEEERAGRLRVRPELVATGGEGLDPGARAALGAAFGCRVRDLFGATEFFALAGDCGQGWLHLNADWAILEAVDADHRPVPPGEASYTVLLTNLANRVQVEPGADPASVWSALARRLGDFLAPRARRVLPSSRIRSRRAAMRGRVSSGRCGRISAAEMSGAKGAGLKGPVRRVEPPPCPGSSP